MPRLVVTLFAALASLAMVSVPLYDFYQHQYSWQFRQAQFIQGGLELLSIGVILFAAGFTTRGKWKYLLLGGLTAAYLRRHNVDVSLTIALLYADSLIGLGSIFYRNETRYKIPTSFLAGAAVFALVAMALSPFGWARMGSLLALQFGVLILFYATAFRESLLYRCAGAVRSLFDTDPVARLGSVAVYICMLMMAAKTAYTVNFDETWYSLRSAEVLNPNGNFFEDLKMLGNWVHQYPKLLEILVFPLQLLDSFTVSKIFSVVTLGVTLVAVNELWLGYKLNLRKRGLMAAAMLSIPAIAGVATSAKADWFSGFVFLMSVCYFLTGIHEKRLGLMLLAVGTLTLTLAIKLSAIAYVPPFALIYVFALIAMRAKWLSVNRKQIVVTSLLLMAFGVVTWRTYAITGIPFVSIADTSPGVAELYDMLGFHYRPPYGPVADGTMNSVKISPLVLLFNSFILPTEVRQSFTWMSNIAIPFLMIAVFWLSVSRRGKYEGLIVVLSGVLIAALIGVVFNSEDIKGGDGNYYVIPTLLMVAVGATSFKWLPRHAVPLALTSAIYVLANLPIAFVSSQSWYAGTRSLDLRFDMNPFGKEKVESTTLRAHGMSDVRGYFSNPNLGKCIAIGEGGIALYYLGCRMETASSILGTRPYLSASAQAFVDMLKQKQVTHFVVQNFEADSYFGRLCQYAMKAVGARVSEFEYYNVVDIRGVSDDELLRIAALALAPVKAIYLDGWMPHSIASLSTYKGNISDLANFAAPKTGTRQYYRSTDRDEGEHHRNDKNSVDKVIFIRPGTSLSFFVEGNGRCFSRVEADFAKHIQRSGLSLPAGEFIVTIADKRGKLSENTFDIDLTGHVHGTLPLNLHLESFTVTVRYVSNRRKLNPVIPAVIINPRIRYCTESD